MVILIQSFNHLGLSLYSAFALIPAIIRFASDSAILPLPISVDFDEPVEEYQSIQM